MRQELFIQDPRDEAPRSPIRDARDIIAQGRRVAEELVARAEREAAELREEAYRCGYQAGQNAAVDNCLDTVLLRGILIRELSEDLQEIVENLVRKLIGEQPQLTREAFQALLAEALSLVGREAKVRLFVNPAQEASTREILDMPINDLGPLGGIDLEVDTSLAPGTARLVTNGCTVIASPKSHLERLFFHMREAPHVSRNMHNAIASRLEELVPQHAG